MNIRYISTVVAIGILSTVAPTDADAATVTDYNGLYELQYTSAAVDFDVTVVTPKGTSYAFTVAVPIKLDANEKIPYSAADPILQNAEMVIENYYPQLPVKIEAMILQALNKALYTTIDEINMQAEALPDHMNLSTVSSKTGTVSGVFVDESAGGQTSMVGTLAVQSNGVGNLSLLPFMRGQIDSVNGYIGAGDFFAQDVQVSEVVKGYSVSIAGDAFIYFNMFRQ